MISFNKYLKTKMLASNSQLCVGLDISPELIGGTESITKCIDYSKKVIDATIDIVAAFKPNLAFFERWGSAGYVWLENILEYIDNRVITIADGKRGDIGNTAEQYANSIFEHFGFDATTVNPYMGVDAIKPFIKSQNKGVFVLCKTSNPSSKDFQNIIDNHNYLYELVSNKTLELNLLDNIGLVVGATNPEEIKNIRLNAPDIPFLIPGVGAQGGHLEKSVAYGNKNGVALISISRAIISAGDKSYSMIRSTAKDYNNKIMDRINA